MDRNVVMILGIAFMMPELVIMASIPGLVAIIVDVFGATLIICSIYNILRFFQMITERNSK